ncbi:chloride channel [Bifidobacterium sp. DSM 109958]|uniref:Chloride channel n=1 Tax=Bifidobacterium moraviense TaxID=2675323 RepID=A0A7Y0F0D2_9BIFI|nr:chloride channel protein [Bifidobacterium sp. DSM 109958]NMM99702.1 chloride channel [Bifidobacterium sp. DSM 109958]
MRRMMRRVRAAAMLLEVTVATGVAVGVAGWAFAAATGLAIRWLWHDLPLRLGVGSVRDADLAQWPFWFTFPIMAVGAVLLMVNERTNSVTVTPIMGVIDEVRRTGRYGRRALVLPYFVAAWLPLAFGAAAGPEAGLANVVASAATRFGGAMHAAAAECLRAMRIGDDPRLDGEKRKPDGARTADEDEDSARSDATVSDASAKTGKKNAPSAELSAAARRTVDAAAVACGVAVFFGLGRLTGYGLALPRLSPIRWHAQDALWAVPALIAGIAAGALFVGMTRLSRLVAERFGDHVLTRDLAVALVVSAASCTLPFMLFSGESDLDLLVAHAAQAGPVLLALIAVARCVTAPLCIGMGWRGGQFFPMIFVGVTLGYALGGATGADPVFCAACSSGALIAMVIRRPLIASLIMMLVMPLPSFPLLLAAAYAASLVPLPRTFDGVPALRPHLPDRMLRRMPHRTH